MEAPDEVQREEYWSVRNLLILEVDVWPVHHHRRGRIKAQLLLCWLALLLNRVIENETNDSWHNFRHSTWGLMAGRHRSQHGTITQASTPTSDVKCVLNALNLLRPPKRCPRSQTVRYLDTSAQRPLTRGNTVHDGTKVPYLCLDAVELRWVATNHVTPAELLQFLPKVP